MRRILAAAMIVALALPASVVAAPLRAQGQASLTGTATNNNGQALGNYTVQLRNLQTGQLAGTTTSSATGGFSFSGLQAGNYAVEVVNASGQIIGTSASISVAAGAAVTGVAVTASAAGATGAAAAGTTAGAVGGSTGGVSTALIITSVAVAGGVVAAVAVATRDASPSR